VRQNREIQFSMRETPASKGLFTVASTGFSYVSVYRQDMTYVLLIFIGQKGAVFSEFVKHLLFARAPSLSPLAG